MRRHASRHRVVTLALTMALAAFGLVAPSAQASDAPPAPTNLRVTELGWQTVELSWNAPLDQLPSRWYYEITYLPQGWTEAAMPWETSLRMSYVEPEKTYTFEVRLIGDNGVPSKPSNRVTVTTPGQPFVPPPTDLEATAVFANTVYLSWQAGSTDPDRRYRVRNLTTGSNGVYTQGLSNVIRQRPDETNSYEVVAVEDDGATSGPSNRITVTTPDVEAPTDVEAVGDGNDVTVTWIQAPGVDLAIGAIYWVYDNGVPVATQLSRDANGDGEHEVTLPRVASGVTHQYAVETTHGLAYWPQGTNQSELSDPAPVTVPASPDTTPPTAPEAVIEVDYETSITTFRITKQSTDDTTPQSEIRYEGLLRRGYADNQLAYYAINHDVPLEASDATGPLRIGGSIRAVDEAGNRSEVITPEFVIVNDN